MTYFYKVTLSLIFLFASTTSNAKVCHILYTGSTVIDVYSDGSKHNLTSVDSFAHEFSDSSPIDNILIKKNVFDQLSSKGKSVRVELLMKRHSRIIDKTNYKIWSLWEPKQKFYRATDFNAESMKQKTLYFKRIPAEDKIPTHLEFAVYVGANKSPYCTKSLEILRH